MTSGDEPAMWAPFSVQQFKLLHQVTKEIPNLDPAALDGAGCPEPIARRLLEVVRRGRNEVGHHQVVRVGFDGAAEMEIRRDIATHSHGDSLAIDTGTTTAAAGAWQRVGLAIAATLGTPEFDHRTGGTVEDAAAVLAVLDAASEGSDS